MGRGTNEQTVTVTVSRRNRKRTDTEIEAELKSLATPLGRFPTFDEIEKHSPALNKALSGHGRAYWARKLGFKPRAQGEQLPETRERMTKWTEESVEAELRRLHQERDTMMLSQEMPSALNAVVSKKGTEYWANKLGLQHQGWKRWDDQRIEREIREYVGAASAMPSQRQFALDNKEALHAAMRRHHGVKYWVKKLNLTQARGGNPGNRGSNRG